VFIIHLIYAFYLEQKVQVVSFHFRIITIFALLEGNFSERAKLQKKSGNLQRITAFLFQSKEYRLFSRTGGTVTMNKINNQKEYRLFSRTGGTGTMNNTK
jgi:hypothetical protein